MNRQGTLRLLALIAALSLATGAIACGDDEDQGDAGSGDTGAAGGSKEVALDGKATVLTFDKGVVSVLTKKKVKVAPIEPAAPAGAAGIRFPITGGTVDPKTLAGSIAHSGGLRLTVGGQTLEVTDFVANTKSAVLTATAGAAEIPLLALDFTRLKKSTTKGGAIVASGIEGSLTAYAASAMNSILGVNFFTKGLVLGKLTVTATAAPS
jgi:hypothetical protein